MVTVESIWGYHLHVYAIFIIIRKSTAGSIYRKEMNILLNITKMLMKTGQKRIKIKNEEINEAM